MVTRVTRDGMVKVLFTLTMYKNYDPFDTIETINTMFHRGDISAKDGYDICNILYLKCLKTAKKQLIVEAREASKYFKEYSESFKSALSLYEYEINQ